MPDTQTVEAGRLSAEVSCDGPPDGPAVVLLHGWPDSSRTYDAILPGLHDAGWRTIVPSLCGYGATRMQTGTATADVEDLGQDALALMTALGIERAAIVGHDWGARAAYMAAHAAPARVLSCAGLSVGYGITAPETPLTPDQAHNFWYQWWFATAHGEAALRSDPAAVVRHIWSVWAVKDAGEGEAHALEALKNPDWVDATLHYYRVRWGEAEPSPNAADIRARMAHDPAIKVPTLMIQGGSDPCTVPALSEGKENLFAAPYARHVLPGIGHFPQLEAPNALLSHLVPFLAAHRPAE